MLTAMLATTDRRWTPAPARPRATQGVVDVWRADLAVAEEGLGELLSAEELERVARIVQERRRVLWASSRGVLRAVLGCYLDRDPRALRFELGPHGKPALHGGGGQAPDLRFNLSHSGEIVVVAVSAGREVGVDVERIRGRYTAELLRAWTLREAAVKCHGTGLTLAPAAPDADPTAGLWTAELDVGPQAAAAVAVEGGKYVDGGQCELCCWEWRG